MVDKRNKLLDIISTWVSEREGAYIAKDNNVLYFESPTGRKQDAVWITLTLSEMVRTIRATRLTAESLRITSDICIEVFQELDRVFEYAVNSNVKTAKHVFNKSDESGYDQTEQAVEALVKALHQRHLYALLLKDVDAILSRVLSSLNLAKITNVRRGELMRKHFGLCGYDYRVGEFRVQHNGAKVRAVLYREALPRHIKGIDPTTFLFIANQVVGELK